MAANGIRFTDWRPLSLGEMRRGIKTKLLPPQHLADHLRGALDEGLLDSKWFRQHGLHLPVNSADGTVGVEKWGSRVRRPILEVAEAAYALALPLREARAAVKREAGRNSQWRSWEPRYLVARLRAHVHEKHPLDGRYWRRLEIAKTDAMMVELAIEWQLPYVGQDDWVLDTLPTRDEAVTAAITKKVFRQQTVPEGISRMCAESAAKGDVADTLARISAGADVERPDGARMMMNALHRAARAGQEGAVRALLESGAVVEARDADGMTALFHAAKGDSKACCRVLVRDYKCDVEARDKNGWTALTHALFFGKKDTTSYLLFVGAKVDARDSQGFGVVERAWGPSVGGTKHELIRTLQSPTRKVLPTYGFQDQRGAEL